MKHAVLPLLILDRGVVVGKSTSRITEHVVNLRLIYLVVAMQMCRTCLMQASTGHIAVAGVPDSTPVLVLDIPPVNSIRVRAPVVVLPHIPMTRSLRRVGVFRAAS